MGKLDLVLKEINKKYDGIVMKGNEFPTIEKIRFSSPRLNYMTYGGIALGKATELFGTEGGGKTTTCLDLAKNAQIKAKKDYENELKDLREELSELEKSGAKSYKKRITELQQRIEELEENGQRKVVYIDAENTLDDAWATTLGVNVEELILIKPQEQTAEQVLQMILDIIKSGDAILVILDSIPMLISQQAFEANLDKKTYAGASGALSVFSQKVSQLLHKYNTAFVAINQVREDFDNPYNAYKTPGGRALKHLFTVRLLVRKGRFIDEKCNELTNGAEEPVGNLVDVRVEKTKLFKPNRRLGHYTLNYTNGVDVLSDTIDVAVWVGIINQGGSWFSVNHNGEELKFQGKPKLIQYLQQHPEVYERVYEEVNNIVSQ